MDQETFTRQLKSEGFETIVTVEREANQSLDLHTHPFAAKALILSGEITIVVDGRERHCRAGDVFQLDANVPHTETYGPNGVTYLAGRKS